MLPFEYQQHSSPPPSNAEKSGFIYKMIFLIDVGPQKTMFPMLAILVYMTMTKFRAVFVHLGLVVTCVAYIVLGAYLFQTIERPLELAKRTEVLAVFDKMHSDFFSNISERGDNVEQTVDAYIENMLLLFENPHYAHVFETHFTNQTLDKDIWTFPASVLFTTTTIIPVGYGNVCPSSELGKLLLIAYGIVGMPLALVTMADTGKFLSRFVTICFNEPSINVIYLALFIIFGVILVTITIDFVAAEVIDRIHYMGRHVGKAREIAGKMMQMAQSLNVNKGITGLTAGMAQLQALARFGLLGRLDKEVIDQGQDGYAFAPFLEDMDFMDNASTYTADIKSPRRRPPSPPSLFIQSYPNVSTHLTRTELPRLEKSYLMRR
ncbi:Ion channel [Teladorsagia circumcincta]|uniref:Ion channel n=1 Tax=Teladorsagia circumcincta TaxID=45464 RepID=A0A2G9UYR3_TELCI|nr:Ion channel [Teladorsagia circumcincta]